jgi:general L-amino acid transport system permease protein
MTDAPGNGDSAEYELGSHPDLPAPLTTTGIVGWLRANLFSSVINSIFTIIFLALLVWLVPKLLNWFFFDAVWSGSSSKDCLRSPDAACWAFVSARWEQFMYGLFTAEERWRVDLVALILVVTVVPILFDRMPYRRALGAFLLFIFPIIAFILLLGISKEAVDDWPYWLMGLSATALAIFAMLPHQAKLSGWAGPVSIVLIVLFVIWGLAAPSNWTVGLAYGTASPIVTAIALLLAMGPVVAAVACLLFPRSRAMVLDRFLTVAILVGVLSLIGYMLPIQNWDPIRGDSPPWVMAIAPAAFAVAALAPWGYNRGAGLAGKIALALAPLYLLIAYWMLFAPPDFLNLGIFDWQANAKPFFRGVQSVLPYVETSKWGGLMLTLVVALTGIVASLPLGIVLALGRRSNMPIIRSLSIIFIEFWRGVPLITVLFMASVMFPLFLPEGVTFNQLLRALIGVALFSAAYMAEVVRGGLQAIPKGQYEAADALGLSYWKSMRLIILPQALKIVIPGIVNTFIGLFKDTTLVSIIGLFDLLGIVQTGITDQKWLAPNVPYTGYVFAALVFWIFCYGMSRYSQLMERKLETGHTR